MIIIAMMRLEKLLSFRKDVSEKYNIKFVRPSL
jgi:hypothetical protein